MQIFWRHILIGLFLAWKVQATSGVLEIPRRDFVVRPIQFYRLTAEGEDGRKLELALTRFDTFALRFGLPFDRISHAKQLLRHRLIEHLLGYLSVQYHHILEGDGELDPEFAVSLQTHHNIFRGRNTLLALTELDNFYNLVGMTRFAKPGIWNPALPLVLQLKDRLRPLPEVSFTKVPDNSVKVYSFRHSEPHFVYIQNATVYDGDINEIKMFTAGQYDRYPISAILFHAAEDLGAMNVSRMVMPDENDENFESTPALVVPKLFVAETDNLSVYNLLTRAGKFTVHQEFPEGLIRKNKKAYVLLGTRDGLERGLYRKNSRLIAVSILQNLIIEPMDSNPDFLRALLPAQFCTRELLQVLAEIDAYSEELRQKAVAEGEKDRPFPPPAYGGDLN